MPRSGVFEEREIDRPVELCLPDGSLDAAAIGWSRKPLHRCNLSAGWPRRKRWNFWAVTSDTHMLRLTYGCTDYVGVVAVSWLEYGQPRPLEAVRVVPLTLGMRFPETVEASVAYRSRGIGLAMLEEGGGTCLRATVRNRDCTLDADIFVARPPAHESLNVVIPWSERSFQFTSKQNTRPAEGTVVANGQSFRFDFGNQSFGCLDFGRGVWPFQSAWNWGAASGWQDGRLVGLNLGGKWTDGTGMTENGFCIDGRLEKVSEPLIWAYDRGDFRKPWRIYAPATRRVDLDFSPMHLETQKLELGIIGTELQWVLGHYSGTLVTSKGDVIEVRDLLGWAEEHDARW
ncbi:MAG TPA: DUF2804 domain-containing protein [Terriglobales bacterium]|nr:DUF2804 domain-containing protein [Terriglobales bacterium]